MNDDEEEKAKQALIRKLILQEADIHISQGERWGAIQSEKQAMKNRYGEKYDKIIDAEFKEKEDALIKEFNQQRADFIEHEYKSWDDFYAGPSKPELEKIAAPDPEIQYSPSYKDTVLQFKQQRDDFMKEHFAKMSDYVFNSSKSEQEVMELLKTDHQKLSEMAKTHYRELLGHHDNPFFKVIFEAAQEKLKDQTVEQAAAEERQAVAQIYQEREQEYHRVQPQVAEQVEAELVGRALEEKNLVLEQVADRQKQKEINPVDTTGDLYERMRQRVKDRKREGYSW